jgi:hypothetical protein
VSQPSHISAALTLETLQPLSFTHHGTEGLPLLARGIDKEGRPLRTVFMPAAQLRGRIRHEVALAELRAKPSKAKLEDAYLLALGQDLKRTEDQSEEAVRLAEQQAFRNGNPLLDLFGTWKVSSRLYVSHLLPSVNVQPDVVSHIRRDLDSNETLMNALGTEEQDRFYQRQQNQGLASKTEDLIKQASRQLSMARKAKDDAKVKEFTDKIEALKNTKKTQKGDDASDNSKHLVSLQIIPAGIELHGKLVVQRPRAYDVSALANAFDGISRNPYMGAQRARGCGEIRGNVTFSTDSGEVLVVAKFGGGRPANIEWTDAGKAFTQSAT